MAVNHAVQQSIPTAQTAAGTPAPEGAVKAREPLIVQPAAERARPRSVRSNNQGECSKTIVPRRRNPKAFSSASRAKQSLSQNGNRHPSANTKDAFPQRKPAR